MSALTQKSESGQFSIGEIFKVPDLDIFQQMICIVLRTLTVEPGSALPSISEIAARGRMGNKQATNALQALVEKRVLTHKAFREIVGDFGDDRLTWAAKGLLLYIRQNPRCSIEELAELTSQTADSERTVREALEDLRSCGYLEEFKENTGLLRG